MTSPNRVRPVRSGRTKGRGTTLIDQVEATPAGAQQMAAARLALNVTDVLRRGLQASGIRQVEWAERAGVSEGRISQLLADGNVRIATVAKFARALGYQPRLVLDPIEEGRAGVYSRPYGVAARVAAAPEKWHEVALVQDQAWVTTTHVDIQQAELMILTTECHLLGEARTATAQNVVTGSAHASV
jgi:transcriptional regulator with XRE-family HTH domain